MNSVSLFSNGLRISCCPAVLVDKGIEDPVVTVGKGTGGVVKELTEIGVEG